MKQGLTQEQLAAEIKRQLDGKTDYTAATTKLQMLPTDEGQRLHIGDHGQHGITDTAHSQISERLGIPLKYYRRMLVEAPELLADNVNHWFQNNPDTRMIRTLDGNARAFLSTRYRRMDHHDLAGAVLPAIFNSGARIHSCNLGTDKMYIQAVVESVRKTIPPPSNGNSHGTSHPVTVSPGIVISNSETGLGTLSIQPAVHFLNCTNMAIWAQHALRKRHLGQIVQVHEDTDIQEFLSDRTLELNDAALWATVKDMATGALAGKVFDSIVNELQKAREDTLPSSAIIPTVEKLADSRNLPDSEKDSILDYLIQGGDLTRFGLSNAVTRASQDMESYDRAIYLEQVGGDVIRMPVTDWDKVTA